VRICGGVAAMVVGSWILWIMWRDLHKSYLIRNFKSH